MPHPTRRLLVLLTLALLLAAPATAHAARTLLVTDTATDRLTAYDVTADGAPVPFAGGSVAPGDNPLGVTVSRDARFAYVANQFDDTVSAFALGTQALTAVGAPVGTGGADPTALTLTPDGSRLLVAHRTGGTVSVFDVDRATGALSVAALAQPAGAVIDDVTSVAVSRDGRHVYVAGRGPLGAPASNADTRLGFLTLNADGTLTPIGGSPQTFAGSLGGFGLTITPDGSRLYLTQSQAAVVRAFDLDQNTGIPTAVAGSPFASGAIMEGILTPDGTRLYGVDVFGKSVRGFTLSATGVPSAISGSPFGTGTQLQNLAIAPDGRALYTAQLNDPTLLSGFSIGATGALTPFAGSPFPGSGGFPSFYATAVTPTQTPDVTLDASPGGPGTASALTAAATVRGGRVTRYDWDFGDGQTLPDAAATASHVYASPGTYTARVTVTNDCDPNAVFRHGTVFVGRTTYCNGSRTATAERTVVVAAAPAVPATPTTPSADPLATFTAATAFTLPSAKRCLKRPAKLTLRFRKPAGVTVDRVEVLIGKRRLALRTGSKARRAITLTKLPTKRFTLTLKVRPRGGATKTTKRTYTVCAKRRR